MFKKEINKSGVHNGRFGKITINNNIENKLIIKEELEDYLNRGWVKGCKKK
jgi:hypothetical protein